MIELQIPAQITSDKAWPLLRERSLRRFFRIGRQVFMPACPVLISLCFSAAIALSDARLAASMGLTQLAAMGFCEPLWFLVALCTTGLCSGIAVGCARTSCANERRNFIIDSLGLSVVLGLALVGVALILALVLSRHPHWLSGTAAICSSYFYFCAWSNLPFTIMQAQCAIFRADNRGRHLLAVWAIAAGTEIVLGNLFQQFGWHTLDALATAWVSGCFIAACFGTSLLRTAYFETAHLPRGKFAPPAVCSLVIRYLHTDWKSRLANVGLVVKIGLPVALSELGLICGSFLNLQIIACLPDAHLYEAAWAIKSRLEDLLEIVPITAIGLVITPFVSRHSRANAPRTAGWSSRVVLDAMVCSGVVFGLAVIVMQFVSVWLAGIFVADESVKQASAGVLSLGSLAWPCFAISQILFSAMEGNGRVLAPTALNIACSLPLRLGLANFLKDVPQFSGIVGVTAAGVIAQFILALITALLFRHYCRLHCRGGA